MIWYIESGRWLLHWFFVNLIFKMVLSLSYLSVLKWRPSFRAPTFGINYMNLLTVVISLQFVSVSNWLQNLNQSKFVPSNLLIFNFGSFTFTVFFLNCLSLFPSFFAQTFVQVQSSWFHVVIFQCFSSCLCWRHSSFLWFYSAFRSSFSLSFSCFILLWSSSKSTIKTIQTDAKYV